MTKDKTNKKNAKTKKSKKSPKTRKSKQRKKTSKAAKVALSITEIILLKLAELGEVASDMLDAMSYPSLADGQRQYWESVKADREISKEMWRNNFNQLERRGYIKSTINKDGVCNYKLTEKGRLRIIKARIKLLHLIRKKSKKNRKWDKKWRLLVFDIPEKRRRLRDDFRMHLRFLGFKQLQKSVWICPFEMDPEFQELVERYKLKQNIVTMVIDQKNIDGNEILKGLFFEKNFQQRIDKK